MNPELEALIKAFDAATQAQGSESQRLEAIYEAQQISGRRLAKLITLT